MSVDVDTIKSALPQEGQEIVTSTDIGRWETQWTTIVQAMDSRITGTNLDTLLTVKCIELGMTKMGIDPTPYRDEFDALFKATTSTLNQDFDPTTITDTQVYSVGDIPWEV